MTAESASPMAEAVTQTLAGPPSRVATSTRTSGSGSGRLSASSVMQLEASGVPARPQPTRSQQRTPSRAITSPSSLREVRFAPVTRPSASVISTPDGRNSNTAR
jgi:hypothetical protein